jgi:voltage-gated sodium channel
LTNVFFLILSSRFDFVIVLNGWLDVVGLNLEGLTILRLLRLLRVFRLVKALPRLRSIVESLIQGFASVGWIIVLMTVFNYILACLGILLFQDLDKFHYGKLNHQW